MWYRSLSVKLIFLLGVITLMVIGVFASLNLSTQRRHLLDFTRQREPSFKPDVDINEVLEETVTLLDNQIRTKEIALKKRFAKLPPIMADPMQLRQAFFNVIINS
jgi:signal transduction histidine kinase